MYGEGISPRRLHPRHGQSSSTSSTRAAPGIQLRRTPPRPGPRERQGVPQGQPVPSPTRSRPKSANAGIIREIRSKVSSGRRRRHRHRRWPRIKRFVCPGGRQAFSPRATTVNMSSGRKAALAASTRSRANVSPIRRFLPGARLSGHDDASDSACSGGPGTSNDGSHTGPLSGIPPCHRLQGRGLPAASIAAALAD